jgi:hypothetical protein
MLAGERADFLVQLAEGNNWERFTLLVSCASDADGDGICDEAHQGVRNNSASSKVIVLVVTGKDSR